MQSKSLLLIAMAGVLSGCSADYYKASADRQVQGLLDSREKTTLGYKPEVAATTTVRPVDPPKKAFETLPMTPLPPPTVPPMEAVRVMVPFGRLSPGPDEMFGPLLPPASQQSQRTTAPLSPYGVDAAERNATARLRLDPPGPEEEALRFDLFGSIRYAVQGSRDYQTQMEGLYLAALDVTLQRHLFEPRPFASGSLVYTGGQRDVNYASALTATGTAGVRQQLPYGGEIVASTLVSFVDAIHGNVTNGENAQLALTGTIPLLRRAGMVNLEPLIESERTLVYQVRAFEEFRRQFALNVASQYFGLITLQKGVINRRFNYTNLARLTRQTEALFAAGRLSSFLEVQRALQAQLSAESSLVDAQAGYQTAVDNFKLLLGMPIDQALEVVGEELDVSPPDVDSVDSEALAIKYRLELKTAEDQIDDARRQTAVAKNGLLPDVNLTAQGQTGNRPNTLASRLDDRATTYSAGITVDLPVDRVAERNVYRRSLINLEEADRNYKTLRDRVIADVRSSIRTIYAAQTSLAIQRRSIELARRRLEYSYERLKLGQGDSRDAVDSQSSLLSAQDSFDQALSTYQIAILRYLRNTGTLRVDPQAGSLGQSMDRAAKPVEKSVQKLMNTSMNK